MRHYSSQRNIVWTILFSILLVVTLNACGDSNNVSGPPPPVPLSPDAKLSSLTINTGPLDPAFSSDVANYSVEVATSVTSVTVTARPQNAGATVSINGQATTSRSVSIGAPGSSTPISIVVTAVSGSQNTYIVTVNKTALGGNNNLRSLSVSPGPLAPTFAAGTTGYTVNVASTVNSVTVTATLQDISASMEVNGQGTSSGQTRSVTLNGPGSSTLITIEVTAPNGSQKTYTVTVNRTALGGNNNLQSLTVSPGPLIPAFAVSTTSYSVDVATSVTSVTVTARAQDAGATVSINGQPTTSRSVSIGASGSSTPIPIEVTAPNGSQKTYLVTVRRAALGGNNNLQNLTVSPGPLTPTFAASTTSYTVNVASTVNSVTVTATLQDTTASMTVNGQGTSSGQARTISLNGPGSNTLIPIEVTAPNGNQKTYLVTVNQAALGGNNNLQSLTVSPGPLAPTFIASTTSYSVGVGSTVNSVTVTATLQDANASMEVNGQGTSSGQTRSVTLNGPGLSTLIRIEVTAPNGSQKTYTVTVNRTALGGNNNLQSLTVSPGALTPSFTANRLVYTVNVASAVNSVTVTAQSQDSGATVSIDGQPTTSRSVSLGAAGSSTEILIEVMAPNGSPKTYAVTVNRAALGGNNNLQSLTVSPGTLAPSFSTNTTDYTVNVANTADSVTVTAQSQDSGATVSIDGQPTTSRSVSLGAPGSSTSIPIEVTAPNGDQKTYTVLVNRAGIVLSGNNNLSDLVVSAGPLAPPFDAGTTSYNVQAPILTADTTITATVADSTATLTINGSPATSGVPSASITLAQAATTSIPIVVTAENGTPKTYTVNITAP